MINMIKMILHVLNEFLEKIHPNNAISRILSTSSMDDMEVEKTNLHRIEDTNLYNFTAYDEDICPYKNIYFCEQELERIYSIVNNFVLNTEYYPIPMQHAYVEDIKKNYMYGENIIFLINPTIGYRIICNKNFLNYLDLTGDMICRKKLTYYDNIKQCMILGPSIILFNENININNQFSIDTNMDEEIDEYENNNHLVLNTLNNFTKFVLYQSEMNGDVRYHYKKQKENVHTYF